MTFIALTKCRILHIENLTALKKLWYQTINEHSGVKLIEAYIFTCVAEGESRFRSAVTPSVCPSVRPSQNLVIATPLKLLIQLS